MFSEKMQNKYAYKLWRSAEIYISIYINKPQTIKTSKEKRTNLLSWNEVPENNTTYMRNLLLLLFDYMYNDK